LLLAVLATGLDFITGFSAVIAALNNLGPGIGEVASHFQQVPNATKWILSLGMLLGRLEIFPILIILTPGFWRT